MCAEAFQTTSKKTKSPRKVSASPAAPKKRAKNYNSPLLHSHCENCDEKEMRFKLIKKITNCKVNDLMKFDNFASGLKVENAMMLTLPPVNEIDSKLHQELLTVMEKRIQSDHDYLHEVLPRCVDNIELMWYKTMHEPRPVFSVAETPSDISL